MASTLKIGNGDYTFRKIVREIKKKKDGKPTVEKISFLGLRVNDPQTAATLIGNLFTLADGKEPGSSVQKDSNGVVLKERVPSGGEVLFEALLEPAYKNASKLGVLTTKNDDGTITVNVNESVWLDGLLDWAKASSKISDLRDKRDLLTKEMTVFMKIEAACKGKSDAEQLAIMKHHGFNSRDAHDARAAYVVEEADKLEAAITALQAVATAAAAKREETKKAKDAAEKAAKAAKPAENAGQTQSA